jgi:DNA-binding winged helix-turn-helix (wHTH) protein/Tol biopolymer transport system component
MGMVYGFGPFTLDPGERTLRRDGQPVPLQAKAFDLLQLLVIHHGQLVRKETIFAEVWKDVVVEDANLPTQINAVRRALGDGLADSNTDQYIETVKKQGYKFVAPVTERHASAPRWLPRIASRSTIAIGGAILIAIAMGVAVLFFSLPSRAMPPAAGAYTKLVASAGEVQTQSLETDGTRVYFSRSREIGQGPPQLSAVAAHAGGSVETVWDHPRFQMRDISPRRSEALAAGPPCDDEPWACELWIVPLVGSGPPRRVGELRVILARWSHDGRQIAFTRGRDVYLARGDGSGVRKLATVAGEPDHMVWAPDDTVLRFTLHGYTNGVETSELWDVPLDGRDPYPVLPGWNTPAQERGGRWTPDGRYYFFSSARAGRHDIWLLDERRDWFSRLRALRAPQARVPRRVTDGPLSLMTPLPSVDGTRLFAVALARSGELVRYDRVLQTFVPFLGGVPASKVKYSVDGGRIAYVAYPEGTLWTMRSDATEKVQLTFAPFQVDGHAWSPDGETIAVHGRMPGKPWHIYLVSARQPATNGTPRRLTNREAEEGIPSWSEDGRRIAFGDVPASFGRATGTEVIHLYDLATGTLSALPGSKRLWTSRWSPDGRWVAALTIDRDQRLMLFDVAKGVWRRTSATHLNDPTWSRDGAYVYYDTESTPHELRRYHVATDTVEHIADFNGTLPLSWSGLAPDDSPLVLRDLVGADIYAVDLDSAVTSSRSR